MRQFGLRCRFWAVTLGVLVLAGGCTTGIKEGIHTVRGASGKTTVISGGDVLGRLAKDYGGVKVETFVNEVGQVCSEDFLAALPGTIEQELRYRPRSLTDKLKGKEKGELGPFFTGPAERTLVIRGRVMQYDVEGLSDRLLGPLDEALCRVQMVDASSGQVLAELNAVGRVRSRVRTGATLLAEGVADAIKDALKPDDDEEEEDEEEDGADEVAEEGEDAEAVEGDGDAEADDDAGAAETEHEDTGATEVEDEDAEGGEAEGPGKDSSSSKEG